MCIHSRENEYLATVTSGDPCTIKESESGISMEITQGPKTVVMQRVHTDLELLRLATSNDECVVSPVVTIHTREISYQYLTSDNEAYFTYLKKKSGDSDRQPIKSEPILPKEARYPSEQQMKEESIEPKDVKYSDQYPMKLECMSPKEAGYADQQSMKVDPAAEEAGYTHSQLMKRDPLSPERTDPLEVACSTKDEGFNTSSFGGNDVQIAHSSQDKTKHFLDENIEDHSVYRFKLTIPHYVDQKELVPLIQVKCGNVHGKLSEVKNGKPNEKFQPYYEVYRDHLVLYANHFCDVVCTCPQNICSSKLLAFPFGQIDSESGRKETHTKVKTYLCSHLYQDESLRKVKKIHLLIFQDKYLLLSRSCKELLLLFINILFIHYNYKV